MVNTSLLIKLDFQGYSKSDVLNSFHRIHFHRCFECGGVPCGTLRWGWRDLPLYPLCFCFCIGGLWRTLADSEL